MRKSRRSSGLGFFSFSYLICLFYFDVLVIARFVESLKLHKDDSAILFFVASHSPKRVTS